MRPETAQTSFEPAGDPGAGSVRWIPLAVLALTCLGILRWELSFGTWPPPLDDDSLGWKELCNGRTTHALEEAMRTRSIAAFTIRPRYNELVFELLGRTVSQVVLGEDGWLFYAPTVYGYPPSGWRERLQEDVRLLESLAEWLAGRGTHLCLIVPPNKESLHAQHLGRARPGFEPVYDELLAVLSTAGLDAPDLGAAMVPLGDASYYVTDTHWTYVGALASLDTVAESLRERFGSTLPGEPVDGDLVVQPPLRWRGDLHAMLGLLPDGRTDRRMMFDLPYSLGLDRATGERIEGAPDGALILTGTSFSMPPVVASILSAVLDRRVTDRSILGLGNSAGVLEVAYDVLEGKRPPPAVLFWEIAERLFLIDREKTFAAVRTFLAAVEFEDAEVAEVERLDTSRATAEDGRVQLLQEGIEVVAEGSCPEVVLELPRGVRADGSAAIRLRVTSDRTGLARLWMDLGQGFEASAPVQRDLVEVGRAFTATLPLRDPSLAEVRRIRIGADCEQRFTLESLELRRR